MTKDEVAQEYHLEGVSRNISPKKTLNRIVNRTDEEAHNSSSSSIDDDAICNEGSNALGGTGPGREQSYQTSFIHGLIPRDTFEHL